MGAVAIADGLWIEHVDHAEIAELHGAHDLRTARSRALGVDQDVLGLQVAMDEPFVVADLQGLQHLDDDLAGVLQREGLVAAEVLVDHLSQRLGLEVLLDEVGEAVVLVDLAVADQQGRFLVHCNNYAGGLSPSRRPF